MSHKKLSMHRTFLSAIFSLAILITITSCQKEVNGDLAPIIPVVPITDTTTCKSCTYYPFCDSTTYTFIDTVGGTANTLVQSLSIIGDTIVDGMRFNRARTSNTPNDPVSYQNCTAGVSTIFGFPQPGNRITTTILKENEPVGTRWSNDNMNAGQTFTYNWEIISKNLTHTVLTVPYSNVIQVHLKVTAVVSGINFTAAESDYFYAPNIGLIDNINFDLTSGMPVMTLHRVLQSYHIP